MYQGGIVVCLKNRLLIDLQMPGVIIIKPSNFGVQWILLKIIRTNRIRCLSHAMLSGKGPRLGHGTATQISIKLGCSDIATGPKQVVHQDLKLIISCDFNIQCLRQAEKRSTTSLYERCREKMHHFFLPGMVIVLNRHGEFAKLRLEESI